MPRQRGDRVEQVPGDSRQRSTIASLVEPAGRPIDCRHRDALGRGVHALRLELGERRPEEGPEGCLCAGPRQDDDGVRLVEQRLHELHALQVVITQLLLRKRLARERARALGGCDERVRIGGGGKDHGDSEPSANAGCREGAGIREPEVDHVDATELCHRRLNCPLELDPMFP